MPGDDRHLVLMGLRGSGKSTVGALLAASLGRAFIDLDPLTARVLGAPSPAEALRAFGEPAFRDGEHQALAQVLMMPPAVIALGGGTPTHPPCADLLRAFGAARQIMLVYLRAAPALLRARLAATDMAARPALLGNDPLAEIDALHARRDPLYASLADVVIEVAGEGPAQTAAEVSRAVTAARL